MLRYGSSVMFPFGSQGVSGLATSDPLAQMTQLALILRQLTSRQLNYISHNTNDCRNSSIYGYHFKIFFQQPIREANYLMTAGAFL